MKAWIEKAVRLLQRCEDPERGCDLLARAAELLGTSDRNRAMDLFESALEVARGLPDGVRRAEGVHTVANRMASLDRHRAMELFEESLDILVPCVEDEPDNEWLVHATQDVADGGLVTDRESAARVAAFARREASVLRLAANRARTLLDAGRAVAGVDQTLACELLEEALAEARREDSADWGWVWADIAKTLADVDPARGREVVREGCRRAKAWVAAGAGESVDLFMSEAAPVDPDAVLAVAQAAVGPAREFLVATVAEGLAAADGLRALKLARTITKDDKRADCLLRMTRHVDGLDDRCALDLVEECLRLATEFVDPSDVSRILEVAAEGLAGVDRARAHALLTRAAETAKGIEGDKERAKRLAWVLLSAVQTEHPDASELLSAAAEAALQVEDLSARAHVLTRVVGAAAQGGPPADPALVHAAREAALASSHSLEEQAPRLYGIVSAVAGPWHDHPPDRRLLDAALTLARGMPASTWREIAYCVLATSAARVDSDWALRIAEETGDPSTHAETLLGMARTMAEAGETSNSASQRSCQ
jgi:hypothetical protein